MQAEEVVGLSAAEEPVGVKDVAPGGEEGAWEAVERVVQVLPDQGRCGGEGGLP